MYPQGILSRFVIFAVALSAGVASAVSGANAAACPDVKNAKAFFDTVRGKVHKSISDDQLDSYKCLIAYWNKLKLTDKRWLSYAMATAWHEARMAPLREGSGGHAKAVAAAKFAYDKGWTKRPYHLPDPVTGKVYYGRGLVQLTWASNYKNMGQALGMGDALYREPDLVLKPDIAAKVMLQGMVQGKFSSENNASIIRKCLGQSKSSTPARLGLYFNNTCAEWYRARRMINGDLAKTANNISKYAKNYLSGLGTMPIPVSAGAGDVIETQPALPEEVAPPEEEAGGVGPLLPDAPVVPEQEEVTKPLTDDEAETGAGVTPPAGGTAGSETSGTTPLAGGEAVAVLDDKPVVPVAEGEVVPKLPVEEIIVPVTPTPDDAGGAVPDAGAGMDGGGMTGNGSVDAGGTPPQSDTTANAGGMTGDGATAPAPSGEGTQVAQLDPAGQATGGASPGAAAGSETGAGAAAAAAELAAQKAEIDSLKAAVAGDRNAIEEARTAAGAAKATAEENKAAVAAVAKSVDANRGRLDEIGGRLQKIDDALAALAKQLAELTKPAPAPAAGGTAPAGSGTGAPSGSAAPTAEPGWFGRTVDTIKGYIWKSE